MNINTILGTVIAKGASRVTRKPIASLRRDVAELRRQVSELKREMRSLRKEGGSGGSSAAPKKEESEGVALSRQRPSAKMIRKLRSNLGLTQADFAKLTGVTNLTVSKWETAEGRITLRARALAGLARVRTLTKRTARAALEQA